MDWIINYSISEYKKLSKETVELFHHFINSFTDKIELSFPIDVVADEFLPKRAYSTDAGLDLFSLQDIVIHAQSSQLISTGVKIAIPKGYFGKVSSRSSLAIKNIEVGAGIIDSAYRGEIKVLLRNFGYTDFNVCKGNKIAQLIIQPCWIGPINVVDSLNETVRGDGGFGSTGI